jgi:MFS family permease
MLAVGVLAQASASVVQSTPAFLIPLLHGERGLSLGEAALLAAAPNVGVLLTLVLWGAATDRWGERGVLVAGLLLTASAVIAAILVQGYLALGIAFLVAGMGSACASSASGRVVIGWFPAERRGFAMGIRQMSQPLGVAIAAVAVPLLVASGSLVPALVFAATFAGVMAGVCALFIVNPARPARAVDAEGRPANPYRGDATLARIHLTSAVLVVPQYVLSTFGLVWLIADQGWDAAPAGVLVAASQFVGAVGRIGAGILSDRVGSRLRPLRWVALAGIPLLLLTALAGEVQLVPLVAVSYLLASCVSVADNGLAFTAVAEIAGAHWSGRALGAQNTGQFIAAAVCVPLAGLLIGVVGYSAAFALTALAPAVAVPLIPRDRVRPDGAV